ncbi:MAG TPA: SPFH domain-containing protein [Pirellulaceae bacterium]|nr:SPFH domain-containing protein [Pirellulaceae bacterium]
MTSSILFAQMPAEVMGMLIATTFALLGILVVGLLIVFVRGFKRCPSNRVLVIYGRTGKAGATKCVHGGADFVWPLIQDYAYLSLEPIQIEVPLRGALSTENIRVNVPSVFTVAIDTKPEVMQNAAVRLLGLSVPEIRKQAEEIIFGQLRQVIASMGIEEINRDRDKFLQHIQHSLEPELAKIGLQLINVNITDITDESGYIDAIGQKAASLAIQQARGDVADNEKMGETRVASAERDKSVQVANARKEQSIGTREAQREQAVRIATLEKEQSIGEKTAAFEKDSQVKQAEQQMRVQVAEADAGAIDGENQAAARVAASQAELAIKKAEAYERGEGRRKQAEAHVMEIQNHALAKAALAEAERVEAEQRAKLEAPAKAQKARVVVDAEAAADQRRIMAKAEADAIYLKLEAEARGQYEILAKKGDGLKQIVEACGGSTQAFQMLMLEHLDNLADCSARAISNIKFDKVVVWENGGSNGRGSTADFLSSMAKTMPPMMQVMRDIGGIELPESLVKLGGDATNSGVAVATNGNAPPAAAGKDKGKA